MAPGGPASNPGEADHLARLPWEGVNAVKQNVNRMLMVALSLSMFNLMSAEAGSPAYVSANNGAVLPLDADAANVLMNSSVGSKIIAGQIEVLSTIDAADAEAIVAIWDTTDDGEFAGDGIERTWEPKAWEAYVASHIKEGATQDTDAMAGPVAVWRPTYEVWNGSKWVDYYGFYDVNGSPFHCGYNGWCGSSQGDYATRDLNYGPYGQSDCGSPVYSVTGGTVIAKNTGGRLFVRHYASVGFFYKSNGVNLNRTTLYSEYGHTIPGAGIGVGSIVGPSTPMATVSNQGTQYCHLHFTLFGSASGCAGYNHFRDGGGWYADTGAYACW